MAQTAPYGAWPSAISADMLVEKSIRIFDVKRVGGQTYWVEMRPAEDGRYALMSSPDGRGKTRTLVPKPFNVRTRVHEYGGNAYGVTPDEILFANYADQRLHVVSNGTVTPFLPPNQCRYADFAVRPGTRQVYAVREDHSVPYREARNHLVMLDLARAGTEVVLAADHDFCSSPCVSPDGARLAWLAWNHPCMPWDETELWVAHLDADGEAAEARCLWRQRGVSLFQPAWSPDGVLHCIADATGWWNLYAFPEDQPTPLYPHAAEWGAPQWVFGLSTYAFIDESRILCTWHGKDKQHLGILHAADETLTEIATDYASFSYVQADAWQAVFLAASPTRFAELACMDLESGRIDVIRRTRRAHIAAQQISRPQAIQFPTADGEQAHAYYYAPANADWQGATDQLPPLLVKSHGGPTSATSATLSLDIQFWTNRGFAVADVNYRGSTGYGTAYRRQLNGQWGVVDVQDCANAARHLVQEGLADPQRLAISGGSAGGYTTLACLAFTDVFHAGISHYGVSDLGALARETHKFESRYLDSLVGPYPADEALYAQRSPLNSADAITCPVLFLQGLEDKIVLPNQAEKMVSALRTRGVPVAYLPFPGEQHGFRQASNIKAAILAELYFLSRIFQFQPSDAIPALVIENWPASGRGE